MIDRALRRLELLVTRRLDGLLHGPHQGLRPGTGSEPAESRIYQPGDDVRLMDWSVTARTLVPHVRTLLHEHEVDTWLVFDLSPRLDFGTAAHTKLELAVVGGAAVGLLAARARNRVGALLATPGGLRILPPRLGRGHVLGLLRRAVEAVPPDGAGSTPLAQTLQALHGVARRRSAVTVISDLLDCGAWQVPLRHSACRHQVQVVEVVDPVELRLPDVGLVRLADPATGRVREIHSGNRRLRERYAAAAANQRAQVAEALREVRAARLRLRTDRDWLTDLVHAIEGRRRLDRAGRRARGVAGM